MAQKDPNRIPGWIVAGFIDEPTEENSRSVPVLAPSRDAAIVAASNKIAGFNPVGAIGEDELEQQLEQIRNHRADVEQRQRTGA